MRNKLEDRVRNSLDDHWIYEPKDCHLSYTIAHKYIPDFVDKENKIIREVKGLWDSEDRRKILAVTRQNPEWKIIMVFQNSDKKISKTSKTSYSDWCTKHDILWEKAP